MGPKYESNGEIAEVTELLCPMEDSSVIHYVGLNYKAHLNESGVRESKFLQP